jgi:hypothetical protein
VSNTDRSFTVRVPLPFYLELAEIAQADGQNLNQKCNQLLRLGLGKHISLDQALRQLLVQTMTEEV